MIYNINFSQVLECVTELISAAAGQDCLPCVCYAIEKVCGCHVPGCGNGKADNTAGVAMFQGL